MADDGRTIRMATRDDVQALARAHSDAIHAVQAYANAHPNNTKINALAAALTWSGVDLCNAACEVYGEDPIWLLGSPLPSSTDPQPQSGGGDKPPRPS